jgi:hypothetical protein
MMCELEGDWFPNRCNASVEGRASLEGAGPAVEIVRVVLRAVEKRRRIGRSAIAYRVGRSLGWVT